MHTLTLTVEEVVVEVSPGVWQKRWTYNGQVPAPTLHGRVGDTFEVSIPALRKEHLQVRVTMINVQGQYATWRATRATGGCRGSPARAAW